MVRLRSRPPASSLHQVPLWSFLPPSITSPSIYSLVKLWFYVPVLPLTRRPLVSLITFAFTFLHRADVLI